MTKTIYPIVLIAATVICVACGRKVSTREEEKPRTYTKVRGVTSYKKEFNDLNDIHLASAIRKGIRPIESREEAEQPDSRLRRIASNDYFGMDSLTHSIPYLVPSGMVLLNKIGKNFQDSLTAKGLPPYRIIVTSVLRTRHDVKRLRRTNVNASANSAHFYGTTFDITYRRFDKMTDNSEETNPENLKMVLAEVLRDARNKGWCYIKYEVKQGCFHITTRL